MTLSDQTRRGDYVRRVPRLYSEGVVELCLKRLGDTALRIIVSTYRLAQT